MREPKKKKINSALREAREKYLLLILKKKSHYLQLNTKII